MTTMIGASDTKLVRKTSIGIIENLSYTFSFRKPDLQIVDIIDADYTKVKMDGCLALGKTAGAPALPVRFVKLLVPYGMTVTNIDVAGTSEEVDTQDIDLMEKPVYPYQTPTPIGSQPSAFEFDQELYSSPDMYPSILFEDQRINYCRGYAILDIALNPIQYLPEEGKLFYYPEMTVAIDLAENEYVNPFYRNNPDDEIWAKKLVYNLDVTNTYTAGASTFDYPGGLCDPSDDYDYVIITTTHNGLDYWSTGGSTPYNWESLMDKHETEDGLSSTLVTIQDIDACSDYQNSDPLFNDLEAHIREFCKDAYQDWGTDYIFIGGDDEWIPARHMKYDYESNVDSDIYWSNLDKTFNADHDYLWGEEWDLGFDLYAELFIGRVTCDVPQDVSNWLAKSFYYADAMDADYLENAAFYGGALGWAAQGDDFIDYAAIKGTNNWLGPIPGQHGAYPAWLGFQFGFETWNQMNPDNTYDLSVKWTAEQPNPGWQGGSEYAAINGLKNAINNDDCTLISAVAHANAYMSMDVSASTWESQYHNTMPFFLHDFGCHCGDMDDADDGVLHSMLFHSDTELAFACVYNTCYGWGSQYDTNSSSALQMKLFWDYMFDTEEHSGSTANWQLGKAMAWSKDSMAPTINWTYSGAPGSWRGVIQGCLLFGDPAQRLKTPHQSEAPETPDAPDGPDEWIQYVECEFSAVTTDPEGEGIYYLFNWGDGNFSEWLGPYPSGQIMDASYAWAELGDYEVKVRARDIWGVVSNWSDGTIISIVENEPPTKPVIDGRKIGFGGVEYDYTFVSTDADLHNIYYKIDWDDGENTDWLGPYNSGEEITLGHSWDEKGKYWVKAWAKDTLEGKSSQASFEVNILTNKNQIVIQSSPLFNMILSYRLLSN